MSTRGQTPPADLKSALFAGPAPDGGLFMPESLPALDNEILQSFSGMDFVQTSTVLARHMLGTDLSSSTIEKLVSASLNFGVPLVHVEPGVWVLELFHGPTMAFKDVGARFMAGLMAEFHDASQPDLTILVATSGDTGSAIARAFLDRPGFRVVVLFPRGQVSERQRKQFTTLGRNVKCLSVDGSFDDCQALVRKAFADQSLREQQPLASANSINIGRLIPQMFYYFHAIAHLPAGDGDVWIATPSGNFGNLTAGLMARRMGLPVDRFVAATNANDVVPAYLREGTFTPRTSIHTLSNAMDVGRPSNFERMCHLYRGSHQNMTADVQGSFWSDEATRGAIRSVFEQTGYTLDPHSAVGYLGLCDAVKKAPDARGIFLATAHPAKFPDVVEAEIGNKLSIPSRLACCLDRPEHVAEMNCDYSSLRSRLQVDMC